MTTPRFKAIDVDSAAYRDATVARLISSIRDATTTDARVVYECRAEADYADAAAKLRAAGHDVRIESFEAFGAFLRPMSWHTITIRVKR